MFKKYLLILMLIPALSLTLTQNAKSAIKKTNSDTLRIHPIGDSITRGKSGDDYRHYLKKRMRNEMQVEVDFVGSCPHAPDSGADWASYPAAADSLENDLEHDGWGGFKIHEIISNTKATPPFNIQGLLTKYPSDIILLMIGTNDVYSYYKIETAPARLDTLIKKIVNNTTAHLIVSTIPPVFSKLTNARIETFNATMEGMVERYKAQGSKISFIDIYSTMDSSDVSSDFVHPNSSGFKKIAEGFFQAINTYITDVETGTGKSEIPSNFRLYQNYPNPFNSDTTIEFSLKEPAHVTLKIYNMLGEELMTCLSDQYSTGNYRYRLDAANLNSGMYFFKMDAGSHTAANRFLLLK